MSSLQQALSCVQSGVQYDENGELLLAAKNYADAVEYFSNAIQQNELKLKEHQDELEEQVKFYKNKIQEVNKKIKTQSESRQESSDLDVVNRISSTIITERPDTTFDEIFGLHQQKLELEQAVILPIVHPDIFSKDLKPYKGFCLFGPPGTGKSHLARACAGEAKSTTFFSITASDLVSKYQGESEALIKTLFKVAREKSPSIIFIDEIDSLARSRTDDESDSTRRIKTELLTQMDGVKGDNTGVFVMCATNTPDQLDDAILSRFEKVIYVPLPDTEARQDMLTWEFKEHPEVSSTQIKKMASATSELSGRDLSGLAKQVKMQCVQRLQQSTHFKEVTIDGNVNYKPCPPNSRGSKRMRLTQIPTGRLIVDRTVTQDDITNCVDKVRGKSLTSSNVAKYEKFAEKHGEVVRKEYRPPHRTSLGQQIVGVLLNFF